MISTCPSCLTQVSHEDHVFEVACVCGARFNPFATAEDLPPMEPSLDSDPEDFSESTSVFKEIVDFGENVSAVKTQTAVVTPRKESPKSEMVIGDENEDIPLTPNIPLESTSSVLLTSGPKLEGYQVESYLGMLSVSAPMDFAQEEPLKELFNTLCAKAETMGANAVVSCTFWISSDGTRAVAAGSLLRCSRFSTDAPAE
jgi:hypothetical protein